MEFLPQAMVKLPMTKPELKCEVCGEKASGVSASPLGPISHALCPECWQIGRQPWSTLIGGLYGVTRWTCADWVRPIIKATCEFYNKTEDELWTEVQRLEEDYDEYMRNQRQ